MAASPNWTSFGTDSLIISQTFLLVCLIGFLNVLPPVFILVGWAFSFFIFKFNIFSLIFSFLFFFPLKVALRKIKSLGSDAIKSKLTSQDIDWLKRKLKVAEMGSDFDFSKMSKIVAGKKLWNYDQLEPTEKKGAI